MIVDGLCHLAGRTNEGIAPMIAMVQEAIERVPQRA